MKTIVCGFILLCLFFLIFWIDRRDIKKHEKMTADQAVKEREECEK